MSRTNAAIMTEFIALLMKYAAPSVVASCRKETANHVLNAAHVRFARSVVRLEMLL